MYYSTYMETFATWSINGIAVLLVLSVVYYSFKDKNFLKNFIKNMF